MICIADWTIGYWETMGKAIKFNCEGIVKEWLKRKSLAWLKIQ
jgi:hypothetical protein